MKFEIELEENPYYVVDMNPFDPFNNRLNEFCCVLELLTFLNDI